MGLHQDKDEQDFNQPIVSLSLGASATFLWGGASRSDKSLKVSLHHADVFVFGGPARLNFHGIQSVDFSQYTGPSPVHSLLKNRRINITWRKAR